MSDGLPEKAGDSTDAEIARVRGELADLTREAAELGASAGAPGTDLVPARSDDPTVAKRQMAAMRADAKRKAGLIDAKRKELERLLRSEMERAEAVLGPMQEMVRRLEAGIFTVNLYLGRDEQIVLLRDGESAPADTPITLRQLLLYMDEECAVKADEGGIEPVEIEAFDEWLLADAANLHQVLPETKGIVALRPRREVGRYADTASAKAMVLRFSSASAKAMAEENRKTYWLVRNGERVYRTLTALEADERVLPYADEFERIFTEKHKGRRVPLRPGSFNWERAQERAEEREQKFMRVGLLLEGLLHRTPIFHPLPDRGVSFLDPACVRDGRVSYITDAEGLLTTGEERFTDWRRRLADELRVGMRIVLGPGLSDYRREARPGNERLTPEVATLPHVGEVFTIEETRRGGALVFRYHEGERWVGDGAWGGGELREPKRRATCQVHPSDGFVLPFDLATVEEMERFLASRLDRHAYAEMWPILKTAIAAKRRETEIEQPFRTMLAGVLARENSVAVEEAEAAVPDLVDWWKLKNRYHRPLLFGSAHPAAEDDDEEELTSPGGRPLRGSRAQRAAAARRSRLARLEREADEQQEHSAKAVRMIVAEHARRVADQRRGADPAIVARLREAHPDALLIARPRRAGYLVLAAAEPEKDVYVHEIEFTAKGDRKGRRDWTLPGLARPRQWMVVYESARWARWDRAAHERDHLRGPEWEALRDQVLGELRDDGEAPALALAWTGTEFEAWTYQEPATVEADYPLTGTQRPPRIERRERGWTRERGTVGLRAWSYGHEESYARHDRVLPFDKLEWRSSFDDEPDRPRRPQHHVLWRDEQTIATIAAERARYLAADKHADKLAARTTALVETVETEWRRRAWAKERVRFDADFGDPELWEAHAKSKERDLRFPHDLGHRHNHGIFATRNKLWDAVALFVERGEDPVARPVIDVLTDATERFGLEIASRRAREWDDEPEAVTFTAPEELHDYVLAEPPPTDEEEAEPDGEPDLDEEDC